MPFRGLLSPKMSETLHRVNFQEVMLSWLPAWWASMALSVAAIGFAFSCSIWATVDSIKDQPIGTPVLLGTAALATAILTPLVTIMTAYFKDRSEDRQLQALRQKLVEMQAQIVVNQQGHERNAANIHLVTAATQKIAEAAEKIVEAKQKASAAYDAVMERVVIEPKPEEKSG